MNTGRNFLNKLFKRIHTHLHKYRYIVYSDYDSIRLIKSTEFNYMEYKYRMELQMIFKVEVS